MNISAIGNHGIGISQAQMQKMREKMFTKLDGDGDGAVSSSELNAAATSNSSASGQSLKASNILNAFDTNQDCSISSSEFNTGMDSLGNSIKKMAKSSEFQDLPSGPAPGAVDSKDMFNKLDIDGDGLISKSEFAAASTDGDTSIGSEIFSIFDTDGDGYISESENNAAMEKFASELSSQPGTSSSSSSFNTAQSMFLQKLLDGFLTKEQNDLSTTSSTTNSVSAYA